jgi:hypothetical protein
MKVSERYKVGIPPHPPADAYPLDALPPEHRFEASLGLFGEES